MKDDQYLCLCFHVTKRKVVQYIRVKRPRVVSEISQCYGAGTGCGWCRPFLEKLLDESDPATVRLPSAEDYACDRQAYRRET